MEQFKMEISLRQGESPLVNMVIDLRKNSNSFQHGGKRERINPHRLLAMDKHEVILLKPVESKVKLAKEEQMPS